MQTGFHPPDGVTETTHPSSSAASIEVVPAKKPSGTPPEDAAFCGGGALRHFWSSSVYGFFSPWNGYGSPGFAFASFLVASIPLPRSRAYSLDRSPRRGSAGGKSGSP